MKTAPRSLWVFLLVASVAIGIVLPNTANAVVDSSDQVTKQNEKLRAIHRALGNQPSKDSIKFDKLAKLTADGMIEALKNRQDSDPLGLFVKEIEKDKLTATVAKYFEKNIPNQISKTTGSFTSSKNDVVTAENVDDVLNVLMPAPFEKKTIGEFIKIDRLLAQLRGSDVSDSTTVPALDGQSSKTRFFGETIKIRGGFLESAQLAKPATLAWRRLGDKDTSRSEGSDGTNYFIKGAFIYSPCGGPCQLHDAESSDNLFLIEPLIGIESDVSWNRSASKDSIVHRVGASMFLQPFTDSGSPDPFFEAHNLDLYFDYRTDRDYRKDIYGFTGQYTPNIPALAIARPVDLFSGDFFWRPYLGAIFGEVTDTGGDASLSRKDDFLDAYIRASAEWIIGGKLKFSPTYTLYRELKNDKSSHSHYSFTVRYVLSEDKKAGSEISVVGQHEVGRNAPSYDKIDKTSISLGVKF